jgi:hypothetical protein
MKHLVAAATLFAALEVMQTAKPPAAWSGATSPHLVASQGVGQVYAEDPDESEQQGREEAVEREGQRRSGEDALLVDARPPAAGGPWIAWYGVAAMISIGLGWLGVLLGRRPLPSAILFYGGLAALFQVAYAVTH